MLPPHLIVNVAFVGKASKLFLNRIDIVTTQFRRHWQKHWHSQHTLPIELQASHIVSVVTLQCLPPTTFFSSSIFGILKLLGAILMRVSAFRIKIQVKLQRTSCTIIIDGKKNFTLASRPISCKRIYLLEISCPSRTLSGAFM